MRRDLHPLAWWAWAIGLAAYASFLTNPWLLLLVIAVAGLVVAARRGHQPWGRSFRLYLGMGAAIVLVRVLFRILLGGTAGHVLIHLPEIPLPGWVLGIRLLGPLTREALLAGLYDGLRLAAIVIAVGAANSLANPKRLLRSVPPALYEIGTALVVAVTILPQLADSVQRVRRAQQLRAGDTRRVGRLRRFLVPVLEDALERSLALAAGMDTRGYGRSGGASLAQRRVTGTLMLLALLGLCAGTFAVLDETAPRWLATPMVVAGLALAVLALVVAGRRVERSVYRPDPWRRAETLVALTGLAVGLAGWWVSRHQLAVAHPDLSVGPQVSLIALLGALVGLLPAVATPEPAAATA
ncbi:energy-coupling factor transporter transmembrane component T [Nocardioides sp. BP30]|uniref:energy-coupling factor transporter transmembrane component T family protein n=1 Tax=Nocardioides sp. BP30 TaxID=3036374 RepID=UPI00246969FF|nr:energy-coupling factor transporter transmembrane component T [Nocardioides sp. BP30]WGL53606.1 energy-coupling factor transporter transmembrane component T [Nocardioides sp. BP30]